MSFIIKYGLNYNLINIMNSTPFKKVKMMIKLFDKPARKSMILISNTVIYNEWYFSGVASKKKYKLIIDRLFSMNFGNVSLYVFT
jgi:hypothetical protein